jgi:hypothetical protein
MLMLQLSYRLPRAQAGAAQTIREQVRQSEGIALGASRS